MKSPGPSPLSQGAIMLKARQARGRHRRRRRRGRRAGRRPRGDPLVQLHPCGGDAHRPGRPKLNRRAASASLPSLWARRNLANRACFWRGGKCRGGGWLGGVYRRRAAAVPPREEGVPRRRQVLRPTGRLAGGLLGHRVGLGGGSGWRERRGERRRIWPRVALAGDRGCDRHRLAVHLTSALEVRELL